MKSTTSKSVIAEDASQASFFEATKTRNLDTAPDLAGRTANHNLSLTWDVPADAAFRLSTASRESQDELCSMYSKVMLQVGLYN